MPFCKVLSRNTSILTLGKIDSSVVVAANTDLSVTCGTTVVVDATISCFSGSIGFTCLIGAWLVSEAISFFFFFSWAFAPKHDAHKPPVDLVFSFFVFFSFPTDNVGNGPGSTNSISGN